MPAIAIAVSGIGGVCSDACNEDIYFTIKKFKYTQQTNVIQVSVFS